MSESEDQHLSEIQKLIRLKRFECPPEGAVDDFMVEFQRRQRSEALTGSSMKLFFERVSTYMASFGKQKWAFAGIGAYACVMLFFLVKPTDTRVGDPGGGAPTQIKHRNMIEEPVYDPKLNRERKQPASPPDVRIF